MLSRLRNYLSNLKSQWALAKKYIDEKNQWKPCFKQGKSQKAYTVTNGKVQLWVSNSFVSLDDYNYSRSSNYILINTLGIFKPLVWFFAIKTARKKAYIHNAKVKKDQDNIENINMNKLRSSIYLRC